MIKKQLKEKAIILSQKLIENLSKIRALLHKEEASKKLTKKDIFFWGFLTAIHIETADTKAVYNAVQAYSQVNNSGSLNENYEHFIIQCLTEGFNNANSTGNEGNQKTERKDETGTKVYKKLSQATSAASLQTKAPKTIASFISKAKQGGFFSNGKHPNTENSKPKVAVDSNKVSSPLQSPKSMIKPRLPRSNRSLSPTNKQKYHSLSASNKKHTSSKANLHDAIDVAVHSPTKNLYREQRMTAIPERNTRFFSTYAPKTNTHNEFFPQKSLEKRPLSVKNFYEIDSVVKEENSEGKEDTKNTNHLIRSLSTPRLPPGHFSTSRSNNSTPRRQGIQPFNFPLGSFRTHTQSLSEKEEEQQQMEEEPQQQIITTVSPSHNSKGTTKAANMKESRKEAKFLQQQYYSQLQRAMKNQNSKKFPLYKKH